MYNQLFFSWSHIKQCRRMFFYVTIIPSFDKNCNELFQLFVTSSPDFHFFCLCDEFIPEIRVCNGN